MVMKFVLLPWKPELVFTGTSVMGINPENMKFCSHVVTRYTLMSSCLLQTTRCLSRFLYFSRTTGIPSRTMPISLLKA